MGKRFILLAFLVVFGIVLALVCFEVFLRLVLPEPESLIKLKSSSVFLFENKPNATFPYRREGEFDHWIQLNSDGFRDREFRKKSSGVLRIAVLGDSQEEALQVPLEATWQKVMARELSGGLGRPVETYNFGVSGYGTDQEWLTLREKVWGFLPDMVILAFSPNDVGDTYKNKLVRIGNSNKNKLVRIGNSNKNKLVRIKDSNEQFLRSSPASPDAGLKNRLVGTRDGGIEVISAGERVGGNILGKLARQTYSYYTIARAASGSQITKTAFENIRVKILGFIPEERFYMSDAQLVQGPFEVVASQKNPPDEVVTTWNVVEALIGDMKKQADGRGAKFLVTINIPRAQVRESDWLLLSDLYKLDPATSSSYEINEVLAGIATKLGIFLYDPRLDAVEWRQKKGDLHFEQDAHFNVNGHEFMGTKVAQYILENGLIQ